MLTLKVLLADTRIIAFIGLNVADLALMVFFLSCGGTGMNPVYSSLSRVLLILPIKLGFVSFSLLALWNFHLLYLLRWINLVMAVVVAFSMSLIIGQFI